MPICHPINILKSPSPAELDNIQNIQTPLSDNQGDKLRDISICVLCRNQHTFGNDNKILVRVATGDESIKSGQVKEAIKVLWQERSVTSSPVVPSPKGPTPEKAISAEPEPKPKSEKVIDTMPGMNYFPRAAMDAMLRWTEWEVFDALRNNRLSITAHPAFTPRIIEVTISAESFIFPFD